MPLHPLTKRSLLIGFTAASLLLPAAAIGAEEPDVNAAESVQQTCPATPLQLRMGARLDAAKLLGLSDASDFTYTVGNAKIARVTGNGLLVPLATGNTNLSLKLPAAEAGNGSPQSCQVPLQVTAAAASTAVVRSERTTVKVDGKSFAVQAVYVPKGMAADVGLGQDRIGGTDSLSAIAKRRGAQAAVNGTFFESYGGIPEPWGMVIADGEVAHVGNTGTSIGFTADGRALMDTVRVRTRGTVEYAEGGSIGWYAYFINRTPSEGANSAILYTPKRGSRIGFAKGTAVVVRGGVVERVAKNENVIIPSNGFVIVYTGTEQGQATRFTVGSKASYVTQFENMAGKAIDWGNVITAVGAGPRVVQDGKISIHAKEEGFTQDKILTSAAARSGIGIRKDGSIVIVTTSATIKQLGGILLKLGAVQGMNLDGGASSGLYANGTLQTTPGRLLSNALIFGNKLTFRP